MSSDREALKADFLNAHGLGAATRVPLAGDASTRRYERLVRPGQASLIFMDQPPVESAPCPPDATPEARRLAGYNAMARLAAGRVDAFVATAEWLRAQGLSAPHIVAHDAPNGLAVLAMIVCITPGTAWAELSLDRSMLMLHVLEVDDPQAIVHHVKTCYERPLMEIFE